MGSMGLGAILGEAMLAIIFDILRASISSMQESSHLYGKDHGARGSTSATGSISLWH